VTAQERSRRQPELAPNSSVGGSSPDWEIVRAPAAGVAAPLALERKAAQAKAAQQVIFLAMSRVHSSSPLYLLQHYLWSNACHLVTGPWLKLHGLPRRFGRASRLEAGTLPPRFGPQTSAICVRQDQAAREHAAAEKAAASARRKRVEAGRQELMMRVVTGGGEVRAGMSPAFYDCKILRSTILP
jgi:hypothetical protein